MNKRKRKKLEKHRRFWKMIVDGLLELVEREAKNESNT